MTPRVAGTTGPDTSIYALSPPDPEPLPRPTRTVVDWRDREWTEIDPGTGAVLAAGTVPPRRPDQEDHP